MQNTLTVVNGSGLAVRTAFNLAVQATATQFAGATDPATMVPSNAFAYMLWIDTQNNLVKQRNVNNDAWVAKGTLLSDGTIQWYEPLSIPIPADVAQGDIIYRGASGFERLPAGVSGQVLKTKGTGADPEWVDLGQQIGIPNNIVNGLGISAGTGLTASTASGRAIIDETVVNYVTGEITLNARMASLIYAKVDGTTGKINATLPQADANTIVRYDFTNWDGVSAIPNSAVGVNGNTVAVANPLTKAGTVTKVDGHCGYGAQGDGLTGHFISANSIGFPTGTSERWVDSVFIAQSGSADAMLFDYGMSGVNARFLIIIKTTGEIVFNEGSVLYPTGYIVENGKSYILSVGFDGIKLYVLVNGVLVGTFTPVINTLLTAFYLSKASVAATGYASVKYTYVELRNKMRTPAQISAISNALLLPCSYTKPMASYPTIAPSDLAGAYHEWKFDETSGTAVADSAGTLNGVATGTTIVDSEIGLGKARKFNGTSSDFIGCPSYQFPTEFTILFSGKINNSSVIKPLVNNRNTGNTQGYCMYFSDSNTIGFDTASPHATSTVLPSNVPVFVGLVFNNGIVTTYPNSPNVSETFSCDVRTGANTLNIGRDDLFALGNRNFNGVKDHLVIIPRALSQAEISQYYNALMKTGKADITEVLPANSICLGHAKTNSTAVIEIDEKYKYGRREGAINGNRRKVSEWKYATTDALIPFDNQFGTENIIVTEIWYKKNLTDNKHSVVDSSYSAGFYGCYVTRVDPFCIAVKVGNLGIVSNYNSYTGNNETTGYIAVIAEVIE